MKLPDISDNAFIGIVFGIGIIACAVIIFHLGTGLRLW